MHNHRIQKLISSAGITSRRKAEELIKQNRVKVNDKIAKIGDIANPDSDKIYVDGTQVIFKSKIKVILLNKPKGVITSCSDNHGRKTVIDLIPETIRKGMHPIGRLDLESRGAILLTNNGELTLKLTHPSYSHSKTYLVWVTGEPSKASLINWQNGLMLNEKKTLRATIEVMQTKQDKTLLKIILKEGRNRQIRRIAEMIGHSVIDLKRIGIAGIKLNGLEEGHWKELREDEWKHLLGEKRLEKEYE